MSGQPYPGLRVRGDGEAFQVEEAPSHKASMGGMRARLVLQEEESTNNARDGLRDGECGQPRLTSRRDVA